VVKDGPPKRHVDVSKIPDAKPRSLAKSRYGNRPTYRVLGKTYHVLPTAKNYKERGIASWYGSKFHGRLTSTREPYNMFAMTAASPVLPIPSFVRVTNLTNGKSVVVKVNDRGPFAHNRILDLSYAAAKKLDYANKGTALVEVAALNIERPKRLQGPAQLYLQVGAYKNRAKAESVAARIDDRLDHPGNRIEKAEVNHRTWYRLQLGPLRQIQSADHLHQQVQALGYNDAYTVVR
jgi:rare lipoprotein A